MKKFLCLAVLLSTTSLTWAQGDPPEADQPIAPPAVPQPPAFSAADFDKVPKSGVKELYAFLQKLKTYRPKSPAEAQQQRDNFFNALRTVSERILAEEKDKTSKPYQEASELLLMLRVQGLDKATVPEKTQLVKDIAARIASNVDDPNNFRLAMSVAQGLEYTGSPKALTVSAYRDFAAALAKSKDPQAREVSKMLGGSARRLDLVGNEMILAGTQINGQPLDLKSLKGKVVLIDFWATWCGPCRAEVPNIKKNYENYKDQGFEVVGVSIDQDREALEGYLAKEKPPWIILHDKGGENPATDLYGIMGIPAMFLVGSDGKVISTSARGAELTRLLEKEFGPPKPKKP